MDCIYKEICKDTCNETFCVKKYKLDYLFNEGLISETQRRHIPLRLDKNKVDLEAFKELQQIETNIKDFVDNGKNLYLHSTICGNGKTLWSLRLIQRYIESVWYMSDLDCRCLFINVPRFLLEIKNNISEKSNYVNHIRKNIYIADIVIWDDIGNKAITQFESDNLLSMIDGRINLGKANIFNSNLSDEEMHQYLGDRLASRIVNLSKNIEFHGADKRGLF